MATTVRRLVGIFEIRADKRPMVDANREMDKGEKQARKTERGIKRLTGAFAAFGVTLGAGFLLGRVRQLTAEFITAADSLDKTGVQVGLATDQLQAFRHAADLSGISASEFDVAMGQLQRNMREFTRGSSSMVDAFRDLGVTVTDESGDLRNAQDVIFDIADAMARTEEPAERVGLAMTVFGRSGRRMLPMLVNGSAALREMTGELAVYGGGISRQAVAQSVQLVDTIARFRLAMRSLTSAIAVEVLPHFTEWTRATSRAIVWVKELIENSNILRATAITVGAALAGVGVATAASWGPAALTVGLVTAAVLLMALAIDDLWVTVQGGESVTRDFIDGMFGVGATAEAVDTLKEAWEGLTLAISDALAAYERWIETPIARAITSGIRFFETFGEEAPELTAEQRRQLPEARRRARQIMREQRAAEMEIFGVEPTPEEEIGIAQTVMQVTPAEVLGQTVLPEEEAPEARPRRRRRRAATPALPAAISPGMPSMLPTTIQPQVTQQTMQTTQTIDARTSVGQIVIQGVQDPEENARAVRREIRRHEGERIRQFQATQVPAAERG